MLAFITGLEAGEKEVRTEQDGTIASRSRIGPEPGRLYYRRNGERDDRSEYMINKEREPGNSILMSEQTPSRQPSEGVPRPARSRRALL